MQRMQRLQACWQVLSSWGGLSRAQSTGAAEALQGVRGAISNGAAAAGNATASAAAAGVTGTVSGLQTAGSTLRDATAGALTGVGGAALGLNTTLVSFAQGLAGLAERVALSGPVAALRAPLNRTRQVAAVAGDLQGLLSSAAVQNLPSVFQGAFLGVSDPPPSSMTAPNLTALDNSLVELLSEDGGTAEPGTRTGATTCLQHAISPANSGASAHASSASSSGTRGCA